MIIEKTPPDVKYTSGGDIFMPRSYQHVSMYEEQILKLREKELSNCRTIATPIAKTQQAREIWFYIMSSGAVLKIVTMEIAQIVL